MSLQTRRFHWVFRGYNQPAGSASQSPWVITDTSAAGTPTYVGANLGGLALTMDNTTEVQNICLSFGDVLAFDIDVLLRMEMVLKVSAATLDTATSVAWGMWSARNDDPDAVTAHAHFRLIGNNNVVCETDDGTTDTDDKATGDTLSTSFKRFAIDFGTGIYTREAPQLSLGGKAAVQFFMSDSYGSLRRVCDGTVFNMNAYSDGLQPVVQIQKTSDNNTNAVTIDEVIVDYKTTV